MTAFNWIQLKRLVGINPTIPLPSQEGQVRHVRDGNVDGVLSLARRRSGGAYEWTDLSTQSPDLVARSWRQYLVDPTATTVTNIGFTAAPTLTAVLSNGDDADGPLLIHTTGAVSGDDSGMRTTFDQTQRQWNPVLVMRVKTQAAITSIRLWCGLTDANLNGSDTPTARYAAFRYAPATDGTAFWRCCTDANTGTPTVTVTTVAVAVSTSYLFRIEIDHVTTEARFYINGVLVATHTSNIPAAATGLGITLDVTTVTAATRAIGWGRVALGMA